MTREQLDEIKKLAEAATPGPYQVASIYPAYGVFRVQANESSECVAMCAVSINEDADEPHVERQAAHARNGTNARAIAALLQHALPLIEALEAAWKERDEARAEAQRLKDNIATIQMLAAAGLDDEAVSEMCALDDIYSITQGLPIEEEP